MSAVDYTLDIASNAVSHIADKNTVSLKVGMDNVLYSTIPSEGGDSMQSIRFRCHPAGDGFILDSSSLVVRGTYKAVFTASNATGTIADFFPHNQVALARLGLWKACNKFSVALNGATIDRKPEDYFSTLSLFTDLKNEKSAAKFSMPDFAYDHRFYTATDHNAGNPLLSPLSTDSDTYQTRVDFRNKYLCDVNGSAIVGTTSQYAAVEWIQEFQIPVEFLDGQRAIHSVKDLDISVSFNADNYPKVFSMLPSVASRITGLNISHIGPPVLKYKFVKPKGFLTEEMYKMESGQKVFKTQLLPFMKYDHYYSSPVTIPAGSTQPINGRSASTTKVPSKVYIYCERAPTTLTGKLSSPETYATIESVVLSWNQSNHHLTNLDAIDLQEISERNGLIYKTSHLKQVGSVICIDLAKDIGSGEFFINELQSNSTLNVSVNVRNHMNVAEDFKLSIIIACESYLEVGNYTAQIRDAFVIDSSTTEKLKKLSITQVKSNAIVGGSIWSGLLNMGKGLLKSGPEIMKIVGNMKGGGVIPTIAGGVGNVGGCPDPISTVPRLGGIVGGGLDKMHKGDKKNMYERLN